MGKKKSVAVTSSRTEFLPADGENSELYEKHGCFVTTRKALILALLAIFCFIVVVSMMYFYGPANTIKEVRLGTPDIENLINNSIDSIQPDLLRLPSDVYPLLYRLRIHPFLEEPDERNFTFTGTVTIGVICIKRTKTIVMNAADLDIEQTDVTVSTVKIIKFNSLALRLIGNETDSTIDPVQDNSNISTAISSSNDSSKAPRDDVTSTKFENDTASTISNVQDTSTPMATVLEENTANLDTNITIFSRGKVITVPVADVDNTPHSTRLVINLRRSLEAGVNYTISIKFSGNILNNLIGLYRTSYIDSSGRKRWLINTNFKPVYARNVFPCFDEPRFKSFFEISIARKRNMTALSNMPLRETEPMSEEDWVWDHFDRSPRMTTYSVAFTVADYKSRNISAGGTPLFKIWNLEGNVKETNYAASISPKVLTYLEDFFGMKYPLPKLDFVAVPDLSQHAIENWGLISFRDSSLLLDSKSENWETKLNVLKSVAEQLSHQWFGKLVSISNWSDFWLREGISEFLAYGAERSIDADFGALDTFVLDNLPILYEDSLKTTKKLYENIEDTSQVNEMYNSIIIRKGTTLIRMLNETLSGPIFKKGIQDFLKAWAYNSTTEGQMWEFFDLIATKYNILPKNVTIGDFMNSWTKQVGYPVLTVLRNYTSGEITLHQNSFVESNQTYNLWIIPVSYILQDNNTTFRTWFEKKRKMEITLEKDVNNSWVLFNVDGGFYRVNYDRENWKLIQKQLNTDPSKIPTTCRAQLLNDAFELAYKGIINYDIPMELTKYLETRERHSIPWITTIRSLANIRVIIKRTMFYGKLQAYLRKLIKPAFEELGLKENPGEPLNIKVLRSYIIETACSVRYQPCLDWAQKQFQMWLNVSEPDINNPIPYTFRKTVICTGIKMGSEREWEFVWNRTLSPDVAPADLKKLYLALGCSRDPWIIKRYLFYSLNGSITLHDVPYVWRSITHSAGTAIGLQFMRENWKTIYSAYDDVYTILKSIIDNFFTKLSTKSDLEDLTMLYQDHKDKLQKVSPLMLNVVERIKTRINWSNIHLQAVVGWMNRNT